MARSPVLIDMRGTQTIKIGGNLPKELAQEFLDAIGDGSYEFSGSAFKIEEIEGTFEGGMDIFYYDMHSDCTDNLLKFCQKNKLVYWGVMEADMEGPEVLCAWIPGLTKKPFYQDMISGNLAFTIDDVRKLLSAARQGKSSPRYELALQIHRTKIPHLKVIEPKKRKG
jgi:hypothetical protein